MCRTMKYMFILMAVIALVFSVSAGAETDRLPDYIYNGSDPYLPAVCDYILQEYGSFYSQEDAVIPCPLILETDDSNPQDVRLWGIFVLDNYRLVNTTLIGESGGATPGLVHLKAVDGGWQVTSMGTVGDGDDFQKDVERIFGMREGLLKRYQGITSDDINQARLRSVSDYVNWNGLNITQMQDFGWKPVALIDAPETAEADQIVHYTSALGYALDYDLRLFSYISFGDNEEGFAGVDALEGISLDVQRREGENADAVAQSLSEGLDRPVIENATIGEDNLAALCVRDAALRDGVVKRAYMVTANDGCLVITVSNTYYAEEGDPVVEGGVAALEALLDSFRLGDEKLNAPEPMTGGWTSSADPKVTDELRAFFEAGTDTLTGISYVPIAYLGSQVVAGISWVLCMNGII